MVDFGQNDRSLGRISVQMTPDEALTISEEIINELKLKINNIDSEKHMIQGKTKLSLIKNKYAVKFWILTKPAGSGCIIDVYYAGRGIMGVDAGALIDPFYKKLNAKFSSLPEMQTMVLTMTEDEIESTVNQMVNLDSNVVETFVDSSTGALPKGTESTPSDNEQQTFVSPGQTKSMTSNVEFMSITQMKQLIASKHDQTKAQWDKNGVVQFKDDGIAILQRMWGSQVQFIIACSQVTKEGYRLMAIDEGKEGSSGGFSGGVNAYFYFQKMEYVR
jgi:hypothetical protein